MKTFSMRNLRNSLSMGASSKNMASPSKPSKEALKKKKKKKNLHVKFEREKRKLHQVREFNIDPDDIPQLYITRPELKMFSDARWPDVQYLQKKYGVNSKTGESEDALGACEDPIPEPSGSLLRRGVKRAQSMNTIRKVRLEDKVTHTYDAADNDPDVTIRGIEHFVYIDLKEEMVVRKKKMKLEVLAFINSNVADPDGLKLAKISSGCSEWARNVAMERGLKQVTSRRGGGILLNKQKSMGISMKNMPHKGGKKGNLMAGM